MKQPTKQSGTLLNAYCNRCFIRLGFAERHLVKDGKTYHYDCYAKVQSAKGGGKALTA
jgi:hypothetical protein